MQLVLSTADLLEMKLAWLLADSSEMQLVLPMVDLTGGH
jgi:hypothetical protein